MVDEPKRTVRLAQPTFPGLDLAAVAEVLGSGWLTNGAQVRAFEQAFATYQGARHAVAVSSCTAALHLALLAHGIGPGDEVITTPFTFAATCNVIIHAGATPVLVDIEPDTLNIDPDRIERAVTSRTRAVLPVHFAGHPADLDPILTLREKFGLALIHDAAHATEARHDGMPIGQQPGTACFSFYATKNLPVGEGGMLTSDSAEVAQAARALRSHGMSADAFDRYGEEDERWRHWDMSRPGYNYKMAELAALLGRGQLAYMDGWRARREALAERYEALLAGLEGVRLCARRRDVVHAHHLLVIRLEGDGIDRDRVAARLRASGVGVAINFRPVHDLAWYRQTFGWTAADYPVASQAGANCISLPLHPEMTPSDVDFVVEALRFSMSEGYGSDVTAA